MGDLVELFPAKKAPPLRVVTREPKPLGMFAQLARDHGDAMDKALGKHIDPELHRSLAIRLEHEADTLLNLASEAEFLKREDLARIVANCAKLISINASKVIAEYYTDEVE